LDGLACACTPGVRHEKTARPADAAPPSQRSGPRAFSPDFAPPLQAHVAGHRIVPLTEAHVDIDVVAINSSLETIRALRGGTWPPGPISAEDDRSDLIVHRQEFEQRGSFAYIVLSDDGQTSAGCIYVYPPNHPFDDSDKSGMPENADAAISCWVTQAAYDRGLYPVIYRFIEEWLRTDWPFERPYLSSRRPGAS